MPSNSEIPATIRLSGATRRWRLTPRQAEVLALLARGLSNKSVAESLGCSERTIEIHVTWLLRKAECKGRAELVAKFWSDLV